MTLRADIAVIGAGMAGASLAAELAPHASVLLIEAEDQPGYHSTGRSAAFWSESYGGPRVQPLTRASGPFLWSPSPDFAEAPLLRPRGAIHIADAGGAAVLQDLKREFSHSPHLLEEAGKEELAAAIPGIRPGWEQGLWEPSCADIDVAALHGAYLKAAKRDGARLVTGSRAGRTERRAGGWVIETASDDIQADVVVNAAGAWADHVAEAGGVAPVGIQPYRRTIAQLRVDPPAPAALPLVIDASGRFYFKPEASGRLWLSPHDETACEPHDCAPENYDIALAIDRLQKVVDWRVDRVEHSWAGLRSFAPDRLPVYGFAPGRRDFFWFAGQGGFGIQTAPAAAKLAASLLLGTPADPQVSGIDPEPYRPGRFTN